MPGFLPPLHRHPSAGARAAPGRWGSSDSPVSSGRAHSPHRWAKDRLAALREGHEENEPRKRLFLEKGGHLTVTRHRAGKLGARGEHEDQLQPPVAQTDGHAFKNFRYLGGPLQTFSGGLETAMDLALGAGDRGP